MEILGIMGTEYVRLIVWVALILVAEYVGVLVAVLIDLRAGTLASVRRGERRTSRGYRRTVSKLSDYYITLLALTVVDVLTVLITLYLRVDTGLGLPVFPWLTTLGAIGLVLIEVKSVMESARSKEKCKALAEELLELLGSEEVRRAVGMLRRE